MTILLCALLLPLVGATQAQTPIPNTFTRLFLDSSAKSDGPIDVDTNGTASRTFFATAMIGRSRQSLVEGYGRAFTRGDMSSLFASVVVGANSEPAPGEYAQATTAGEARFGAAARVRATRTPPFSLFPPIVPVTLMKSGSVEVSGHPDVVVIVDGISYQSRGVATIQLDIRGEDTSVLFSGGASVNTADTPDLTNTFGPERIELNLRVGVIYSIGLAASCTAVSPADGLYVESKAEIDPVFEFDQERFDAMARDRGLEPFKLADYYAIAYSPNLPGPPLRVTKVNGQVEISWSDGVLQSSTEPQTGWVDLTNSSPYRIDPRMNDEGHRFFRTRHETAP